MAEQGHRPPQPRSLTLQLCAQPQCPMALLDGQTQTKHLLCVQSTVEMQVQMLQRHVSLFSGFMLRIVILPQLKSVPSLGRAKRQQSEKKIGY